MSRKSRRNDKKGKPTKPTPPAHAGTGKLPGQSGAGGQSGIPEQADLSKTLEELLAPLLPELPLRPRRVPEPRPRKAGAQPSGLDNTTRSITIDGIELTVKIERKHVKNINARLYGNQINMSVPMLVDQAYVDEVIPKLARRLLRRQHTQSINRQDDALELARRIATRFPTVPQIDNVSFVTTQEARWGSYSSATHTIRINAALRHMPPWVLEAVIAHELAHIFHYDHSPAFWALLRRVCPDTDRARGFLHGVAWLSRSWDTLPPIERSILGKGDGHDNNGEC